MKRIQTKRSFLQSLSSVGDVNTFQKSWQGGVATQITPGVIDCFSLVSRSLNALPTCTGWVLASFLQKTLFALEKSLKFLASVSAASASKEVDEGKTKKSEFQKGPVLHLTHYKPCAGTLFKERTVWQITKLLSAFLYPVFHLSCFCVKGKQITVSTNNPQLWLLSSSPINVPGLDYQMEDGYSVKISWSIIYTVGNELNWIWIALR